MSIKEPEVKFFPCTLNSSCPNNKPLFKAPDFVAEYNFVPETSGVILKALSPTFFLSSSNTKEKARPFIAAKASSWVSKA